MKKQNSKKLTAAFQKNLAVMTNRRIESMIILDSQSYIRFLQDPRSGFYIIFNGRLNASHYAKSYQMAERFFNQLVAISQ